ncbi:MAG: NUDIX domain-containing protein [Actinobacteria bacterium]|nr:NUDIX domain-containing protein [Actinomycetota bacterium]
MQPPRVRKAFAYITRGDCLLVFHHRDVPLEEAGVQVPAGTVRDDEPLAAAALREAVEETGLEDLTFVRYLGTSDYDVRPGRNEVHERQG